MLNGRLILAVIFIIGLIAISSASAADANDAILAGEIDAGELAGADGNLEVLSGDNAGYNDLREESNAGNIALASNDDEPLGIYDADEIGCSHNDVASIANGTANKTDSTLEVDDVEMDYGDSVNVNVTYGGATGFNAKIDSRDANVVGNWIQLHGLSAGTHYLTVTTVPDDNHTAVSKTVNVTVRKVNSSFLLNDHNLNYGIFYNITVSTDGAEGITAKIDNESISVDNFTLTIPILDAGIHNLTIATVPDDNHTAVSKTVNVNVSKVDSLLKVGNFSLDYGSSANIKVVPAGTTGITAKIGNESIASDNFTLTIPILDAGTHNLTVTTVPDDNHYAVTKTATITVSKVNSSFSLQDISLVYGRPVHLNVSAKGATGITAEIDGEEALVNGYAISIPLLSIGNHTLTVAAIPDGNHYAATKTATITVSKVNSTLLVNNILLSYGRPFEFNVSFEGASGITAKIDNVDVDVDGKIIRIPVLDIGNHTLTVTAIPDDNHISVTKTATVTVNKIESRIISHDFNCSVSQTVNLTAHVIAPNNFTVNEGTVVFIDGETGIGTVNVVNGTAALAYSPSEAGNHVISVIYEGSAIFESSNSTFMLTVLGQSNSTNTSDANSTAVNATNSTGNGTEVNGTNITKLNPYLRVSVSDINVGENASVDISINENATGKVTLTINDAESTLNVSGGKCSFIIRNLAAGDYSVLVKFEGDRYYFADSKTASFKVIRVEAPVNGTNSTGNGTEVNGSDITRVSPDLKVSVSDINVGENAVVDISINENATGRVTLTFKNSDYDVKVVNGKSSLKISGLPVGDYSVLVRFDGDRYYLSDNKTVSFKVIASETPVNGTNSTGGNGTSGNGNATGSTKQNPDLMVIASDVNVGENAFVNVSINENVTGMVTLTFNGSENIVGISNGRGSYTIHNLDAGNYSALVRFLGDKHFNSCEATVLFRVIDVEAPVNETNATGGNGTSGNGTDILDNNGTGNGTDIVKSNPNLTVDVADVNVGEAAVADISINENATGSVTLTFNNVESIVDIYNGGGSYSIPNLAAGNYSVLVRFSGDGLFNACEATASFKVIEVENPINSTSGNVTGNNTSGNQSNSTSANETGNDTRLNPELAIIVEDIIVGEDATLYIEANANVTGKIIINGQTVNITNGRAECIISNLAAGEYNITAVFEGDEHYKADVQTSTLKVNWVEMPADKSPFNVDENSTSESGVPTYSISLPSDATGNLTVTIAGKNYTAELVNGSASIKVPDMPAGDYKVVVSYSGDGKYAPIVQNTTSKVVVDPKVVMKQSSVLYTAKYSIEVYGKDGKPAKYADVVVYINGKKVKALKTDANGVATFNMPSKYLPNKKYVIAATALGKSASKKVTVKQILSIKKVKVKKSAKKLVLTATLKKVDGKFLKGKKITFRFNGKKIKTVKTNKKGVAKVTIKKSVLSKLKVGKKVTYKATYLKTTVKKTAKVKR